LVANAWTLSTSLKKLMDVSTAAVKANAERPISKATDIATTATTTADATGMLATAVVLSHLNSAKNASVKIATTSPQATNALKSSNQSVRNHFGRETDDVTTATTMLVAVGMEAIAAVMKRTTSIARNASAWTARSSTKETNAPKQSRAFAVLKSSSEMASVMTATTMPGVPGIKEIAVASVARPTSSSSVQSASAWIVHTNHRVTNASLTLKASVESQLGRATIHAMMRITMPVAIGTAGTVVAPKFTSTAKSANVVTAHMCTKVMPAYQASKALAFSPTLKETAFATTKITTRAATGTTVIAVGSPATHINTKYARSVNVWTVLTSLRKTSVLAKSSRSRVATPISATEFAMMSTTMVVATGTTVIAAARLKSTKRRIAPSASAKIAKLSSKSARKQTANVGQPIGKATRDATTKTTTAHAIGTAETAVARKTATSIAKSANVWIQKIKNALESVGRLIGPRTVSATTITTTVVVDGMQETAAVIPKKRISSSSVKTASV